MAYRTDLGYDDALDYSKELSRTDISDSYRKVLENERTKKINHLYGGVEPNLAGSNMTYTQALKNSGKITNPAIPKKPQTVTLSTDYTLYDSNGNALPQEVKTETPVTSPTDKAMSDLKGLYIGPNSMYAQALANNYKITDAGVKKAVGELESQKTETNRSFANLFKQLYQEKKGAEKNIDQQLAHQGITGGMSESTRLGINTSYADALRQGEQERIQGINDLDRAITDVRLDGDIAKAQAAIDANNQAMTGYAAYLQTVLNRADNDAAIKREQDAILRSEAASDKSYAYQYALAILQNGAMPSDELLASAGISKPDAQRIADSANYEKNLAITNQDKSYTYQYVMAMLQNGLMPSDDILTRAGINKADAEALRLSALNQTAKNNGLSYSAAFDLANNGIFTPEVISALKANGYTDELISRGFLPDRESLKNQIGSWGYISPDGQISLDGWEVIKLMYPGLISEDNLAEMGLTLGKYYTDPLSMSDTAQSLYNEINSATSLSPAYNYNVIQARQNGSITEAEYNTLQSFIKNKFNL